MTLGASNNTTFGGTLINQKYSPLERIEISETDRDFYVGLFNRRINALSAGNVFPKKLSLLSSTWPTPVVDTPPMVVISSNRAEWMSALFESGDLKNRDAAFTGYNDRTTFAKGPVAWYDPLRSQRPLFIVVHHAEYAYYRKLLGSYRNVYIVGWRFQFPRGGLGPAGFGASRFAALELVKMLGYHKAWTVDDNVVNVNGFPNRLATIEAFLTADMWGIGFSAATINQLAGALYDGTATFTPNTFDFTKQKSSLLQQVVLWNVDLLRTNNLNMSHYFVTSNEDVSFINYLQTNKKDERMIKSLSVLKLEPTPDKENRGVTELGTIKASLLKFLFNLERTTQIKNGTATPVNLGDFVKTTILPQSLDAVPKPPNRKIHATQSMAIEQALAMAVSKGWAPAKIFDPYQGFEGTKVEPLYA
jgi:hypothetical protein